MRWPVREVVERIVATSGGLPDRPLHVRVAGHIPFFDGPVLNYESVLRFDRFLVYNLPDDHSLHGTFWDYVLVTTGPIRTRVDYREPQLATLLSEGRLPFTFVNSQHRCHQAARRCCTRTVN